MYTYHTVAGVRVFDMSSLADSDISLIIKLRNSITNVPVIIVLLLDSVHVGDDDARTRLGRFAQWDAFAWTHLCRHKIII